MFEYFRQNISPVLSSQYSRLRQQNTTSTMTSTRITAPPTPHTTPATSAVLSVCRCIGLVGLDGGVETVIVGGGVPDTHQA